MYFSMLQKWKKIWWYLSLCLNQRGWHVLIVLVVIISGWIVVAHHKNAARSRGCLAHAQLSRRLPHQLGEMTRHCTTPWPVAKSVVLYFTVKGFANRLGTRIAPHPLEDILAVARWWIVIEPIFLGQSIGPVLRDSSYGTIKDEGWYVVFLAQDVVVIQHHFTEVTSITTTWNRIGQLILGDQTRGTEVSILKFLHGYSVYKASCDDRARGDLLPPRRWGRWAVIGYLLCGGDSSSTGMIGGRLNVRRLFIRKRN